MLECHAYGVGHADDGICLGIQIGPHRVLLDCGLRDLAPLCDPDHPLIDAVLCSHAHPDHIQGLPTFHDAFPDVPIYTSAVTARLLHQLWPEWETIATAIVPLPWRSPTPLIEGLEATLYPAGHLPGAAVTWLNYTPDDASARPYSLCYSGDFFLSNARLVEGLPLEELRSLHPDVLVLEGSYGTARHPHRRQQENHLAEQIHQAIAQKQSVLLPVEALGPAQELLMLLRSHHHFTGKDLNIWIDDRIGACCDAYLEILSDLPVAVQNFARHQSLFWDERIRPRVRRLQPHEFPTGGPAIVLTDLQADLQPYYAENPSQWQIFWPRSTPESPVDPPAAENLSTDTPTTDTPTTDTFTTEPAIASYLISHHSDGSGTTQLIHNLRPQHVILVHGDPTQLADLANLDELSNRYHLHTPIPGSLVELPLGDTFLQPVTPTEITYEGDLTEFEAGVAIILSSDLIHDPRWRSLSDTGLIQAHWQGNELVLRGLSQRELLRSTGDRTLEFLTDRDRACCNQCRHYRSSRCWNPDSPLYEFKVPPTGFCPVFEAVQGMAKLPEEDPYVRDENGDDDIDELGDPVIIDD